MGHPKLESNILNGNSSLWFPFLTKLVLCHCSLQYSGIWDIRTFGKGLYGAQNHIADRTLIELSDGTSDICVTLCTAKCIVWVLKNWIYDAGQMLQIWYAEKCFVFCKRCIVVHTACSQMPFFFFKCSNHVPKHCRCCVIQRIFATHTKSDKNKIVD